MMELFSKCSYMYGRMCVVPLLFLLEAPVIPTRRRVGVSKVLRKKKIGGGVLLMVKLAAAGAKRKEKLACLVVDEIAGKQIVVLTMF